MFTNLYHPEVVLKNIVLYEDDAQDYKPKCLTFMYVFNYLGYKEYLGIF